MDVLLIGGTRNVGHHLALALAERGHAVTTLNRGRTLDELGDRVERLHADRTDPARMTAALGDRAFDAVVDTIAMRGSDTLGAIEVLTGRTGHYVHLSTGQVYLVRAGCPIPAREEDYEGPLVEAPAAEWEAAEWRYGIEKRECEDALVEAWRADRFPATRLRLPMIHGERDHYHRIHGVVARMLDGGPILVPVERTPRLRHVDVEDVVAAIVRILESGAGRGRAYNLAQDDDLSLDAFLARVGELLDVEPEVVRLPRAELEEAGLFPDCCRLANPWMSTLDNRRAVDELELEFAGFDDYLPRLVAWFRDRPEPPPGFDEARERERGLAAA